MALSLSDELLRIFVCRLQLHSILDRSRFFGCAQPDYVNVVEHAIIDLAESHFIVTAWLQHLQSNFHEFRMKISVIFQEHFQMAAESEKEKRERELNVARKIFSELLDYRKHTMQCIA